MVVPVSPPVACRTSSMSLTIASKSAVPSGWNTIAALPEDFRPTSVSSVTIAVLMANRRSSVGWRSFFLPRSASRNPPPMRLDAGLPLRPAALQGGDPLLHRRVRREQAADRALGARREDVERRQLLGGPHVLLRDLVHAAGDLHQRAGERRRAAS